MKKMKMIPQEPTATKKLRFWFCLRIFGGYRIRKGLREQEVGAGESNKCRPSLLA